MYLINKEVKLVRSALAIPDTISYMQASDLDKVVKRFFNPTNEIENKWFNIYIAVTDAYKTELKTTKLEQETLQQSLDILSKLACLAWFLVFKEDYYTNAYLYVNGRSTLDLQDVPLNNFLDLYNLKQSINPDSSLGRKAEYKERILRALRVLDRLTHEYTKDYKGDTKPIWNITKIIAAIKEKNPGEYITFHKGMVESKIYMDYTATKIPALSLINIDLLANPDYIADPITRALEKHYADAIRLAIEDGWCSNKIPTIYPDSIPTGLRIWSLFNSVVRLKRILPYAYKILIDRYAIEIKETMESLCSFNRVEATHMEVTFHYDHSKGTTSVTVPIVPNNIYKME